MSKRALIVKSGAVAAALVIFAGFGVLFDNFVRSAATQMLQITISDISKGAEVAVFDATHTLDEVAANNADICTAPFVEGVRQILQHSIYVRQIIVENNSGARYCSGLEVDFDYQVMSTELPIPGREETLAAIRIFGTETTLLRITNKVDENRTISAFVHYAPILGAGQLPGILSWGDVLRVEFTDGTELLARGDRAAFDFDAPTPSHIYASEFAGELPLRTRGSIPIEVVRAQYKNMYMGVIGVMLVFGFGVLFLVFRLVGKGGPPPMDLGHAIENGQIQPFYQPIINMRTGKITGCEVLARWVKPDGRIIYPDVFVEYAEASGLEVPLMLSIMQRVKLDLADISQQHGDIRISINLFDAQLSGTGIVDDVRLIFEESNIAFDQLVFEIGRRQRLTKASGKALRGLRKLGCKLALDDESVGVADLKKLKVFGIGEVKIGSTLISNLGSSDVDSEIVEAFIAASLAAKISIVAKRVERKEQALFLREHGVDNLQGHLFTPALDKKKFAQMHAQLNGSVVLKTIQKEKPIKSKKRKAA